jgi:phage shock protein PspC (stress-responsive transcriptional regulator)
MKQIQKVSIADISFTLDNDAYVSLKQYLDSLHKYYDKDPDGIEITRDIEARIAELILGEQVYTKVVSKQLIDGIIAQLGSPEEIDSESSDGEGPAVSHSIPETSIPRRLHRIAEGRIFGGVCSGIAKYFDISVAWVRLIFLVPIFFIFVSLPVHWYGFKSFSEGWSWVFILTYIVLWIALPIAKTPRQKLEARGEKITPSSIRQNLQEVANTPSTKKAASIAAEILTIFGRIVLFLFKFVAAVCGFSFIFASMGIFIAMIIVVANPGASAELMDLFSTLSDFTILSPLWFVEFVLFCAMMPLFIVGMTLLAVVFGWRFGRTFLSITLGIWGLAMIFTGVVALNNAGYMREQLHNDRNSWWFDDNQDNSDLNEGSRDAFDNDAESVSVDSESDSLVVIIKKDGSKNDTVKIVERGIEMNADDKIDTVVASVGRRIEIRRIEE